MGKNMRGVQKIRTSQGKIWLIKFSSFQRKTIMYLWRQKIRSFELEWKLPTELFAKITISIKFEPRIRCSPERNIRFGEKSEMVELITPSQRVLDSLIPFEEN